MKTQTALIQRNNNDLIQRKNDDLGKGFHYNMCKNPSLFGGGLISVEIRKAGRYRLTLKEISEGEGSKLLAGTLSSPLLYNLKNFVLLKHLYHNFGEDINFKDFYEGTENGLKHSFKRNNGLDGGINISEKWLTNPDAKGYSYPYKKMSKLNKKMTQLYNERERTIQTSDKMNQYIRDVGKKLNPRNNFGGKRQLKDIKADLRNTGGLSKIYSLNQKIIGLYNKKEETSQFIKKMDQVIGKEFDSRNGLEEQLKDFKIGLRNTKALGELSDKQNSLTRKIRRTERKLSKRRDSLTEKIKQTEKKLSEYFNFIDHRRGIHITAESKMENAYEIITDFYKQFLNPTREEEDFDVAEATKEIEAGWGKTKQLARVRLK